MTGRPPGGRNRLDDAAILAAVRDGASTVSEIAQIVGVDRAGVVRSLLRLQSLGLVRYLAGERGRPSRVSPDGR